MVVSRSIVEKKLAKLEHTIRKLTELSLVSWEEYNKSEAFQDRTERNLQLAAQVCVDIGSHIIADRGYRSPEGYADVFTVLYEKGLLPGKLTETMRQIAGFRNILVHEYLEIDNSIVYECLSHLHDFKSYAAYVVKLLQADGQSV